MITILKKINKSYFLIVIIFLLYPINLKSNPLRKNLGFEKLASKIHDTYKEENISKIRSRINAKKA